MHGEGLVSVTRHQRHVTQQPLYPELVKALMERWREGEWDRERERKREEEGECREGESAIERGVYKKGGGDKEVTLSFNPN